jgi:STE24 endopeptidase
MSPVMIMLSIPANIISRKHEFEADAYERELAGSEVAISALKKLYREDLGNLTPHPFVVLIEYSHPTLTQRVAALDNSE